MVHRLKLWESVEKAFTHLRCSNLIVPLLNRILGSLASAQPPLDIAAETIYQFYREGRITVDVERVDGRLDEGKPDGNYVTARSAVEELRRRGVISEVEYGNALEALGSGGAEVGRGGALPENGGRVACSPRESRACSHYQTIYE